MDWYSYGSVKGKSQRMVTTATITLLASVVLLAIVSGHVTEIILDDDEISIPPSVMRPNEVTVASSSPPSYSEEKFCHVEYQVMKRTIGKCVKLGRSIKGCAAGNYIQPLHPDCN